ncbi:MAG TPA: BMP family ABC transporter substrate-binding protein [Anaerolineaceae bacterium]|jgi:basic membrane protein A|nr:BMP family ABC transporter substrate-binding protein [Anaerolineaceae bacterium]
MKSKLFTFFALLIAVGMLLTACSNGAEEAPASEEAVAEAESLKVIHLVNGVLGDKSFFDSAERGIKRASEEFGFEYKTIEMGTDPTVWESGLADAAANEDYDIMIMGTYQMIGYLEAIAGNYPDKYFMIYDSAATPENCSNGCANVYSITYKQNEGSYVAGVYAGLMTQTGIVGVVGAQDIPVINDFIVGYTQGVKSVNPDYQVLLNYAGGWNDPAKGKEQALAMYQQGADYVFQVAGATGDGIFQAAQETGNYAIGVDSDQATIIKDTNPELAAVIATSMMKNVDNSLYRALTMHLEGTLTYGTSEALGITEGGVGIAKNEIYEALTPSEVKDQITQIEADVASGKITVDTAF